MAVFRRQKHLGGGDAPVDSECGVVPRDGAFGVGGVIVVALVLEERNGAQYRKAVCEAARDEELTFVLRRQLHGHVAAESG